MGAAAIALAAGFVAPAIVAAPAYAQDYTSGAVTGTVVDQDGAVISSAVVKLKSVAQGFERDATSNASGDFRIPSLPQGEYTIEVTASGFDPLVKSSVNVSAGQTADFTLSLLEAGSTQETIVVTGVRQNLDFAGTTQGLNIDVTELAKSLPVGRNLTALTLLAPSTTQGDSTFGDFSSIAGSSVAENAYYLNGLNMTNFDNYIGSSLVPFEFYQSVEVKTSAYPAEYGRATGGILNAVSKSGTNEFTAALHLNYEPDGLNEQAPDTYAQRNALDQTEKFSATIEAGGPIIKDHLFFYGLYEMRDNETKDAGFLSGAQIVDSTDDPFYGFKIDGYITDDHHLEFTFLDTSRQTIRGSYSFDSATDQIGALNGQTYYEDGGESYVGKYTGTLTNWLTVSAAYGINNDQAVILPGDSSAYITDSRDAYSGAVRGTQTSTEVTFPRETRREFYRADVDTFLSALGDHHVRFGYDQEKLDFSRATIRPGPDGVSYEYFTAGATDPLANGPGGVAPGTEYVEVNYYESGGQFYAENTAFYVQDEWQVNDRLTLNLGVRLDQFANFNAANVQYVDFDDNIGERLGFTFDPTGEGRSKFYGNFGRYFLPVASNTSYRQGAAELYYREYYEFTNDPLVQASPTLGAQITDFQGAQTCPAAVFGSAGSNACVVTGDGSALDASAAVSQNLTATEQEEFVLGYEYQFNDLWSANVAFVYRDLIKTAEDVAVDIAVIELCQDEGISGCEDIWTGYHQYTIINPGESATITLSDPLPGETEVRTVDLSAQSLGYPSATRTYQSLEFSFDRTFDGLWGLRGSYTLSESRGNSEGYVKSDNGQDDSGITTSFDTPNLTDGTDGLLPNHRAHNFKLFGSYQVTDNLLVGANASLTSPRKFGCIGRHPVSYDPANGEYDPANLYGAESFYCAGQLTPRGSVFESDWSKSMDVSFRYKLPIESKLDYVLRADIFNIFNFQSALDFNELGDQDNGTPNPNYRKPTSYQTPRYVRLGFDVTF